MVNGMILNEIEKVYYFIFLDIYMIELKKLIPPQISIKEKEKKYNIFRFIPSYFK